MTRFVPTTRAAFTALALVFVALVTIAAAPSQPSSVFTVIGVAEIEDGDSLSIGDIDIRLHGIDAPEPNQTCWDGSREHACGRRATRKLELAVRGRDVRCEARDASPGRGTTIAVCYVDGADLGNIMVRSGWAVSFERHGDMYDAAEADAREGGRGLWRWQFTRPLDWRRLMRSRVRDPDAVSDTD